MSAALQRPGPGGRISRLIGLVVTFVTLLSVLAISAPVAAPVARAAMPAPTGPSWGPCPANGWLSQSAPDPNANNRWVTRLSSVEVASSHVEWLRSWYEDETAVRQLNAIAFNSQDNFLYGFRIATAGTPNEFVRIDSNSNFQFLGLPGGWAARGLPPQDDNLNIVIGDIDNEGFYWVLVPGAPNDYWVQIRLSDWTVADHGEIDPADPALTGLGGGADWAYQAGTDYLFRVMRTFGGTNPYVVAFNKVTKTWTRVGLLLAPSSDLPSPPNSQYGAMYAAADGTMYAGNNPTGIIWAFKPGDPMTFGNRWAVQGLSHGEVEGNDAARCNTAVVEVDFGDAPDSYLTRQIRDGARHSVLPLAIGSVVDTENDAPAALLDGTGDDQTAADDEDAFSGTIQLGGLGPQSLQVTVINNTDEPATLIGYLDMNQANGFEGSEASNVVTVAPHLTAGHQLTWNLPSVVSGASYVRLRLASGSTVAGPTGVVYGGEVEDHPVNFTPPAPTYTVAKTASVPDGDLVPGQEVTYTVTVANTGPVAAPASFTDELADILDDAELIGGPTVNPPNGTAAINGTTLSWSGTLAPGGDSVMVQYTVRVKDIGANGSMPNTVVGGPGSSCGAAPADCTTQHESGWYTVEKWEPQGIPAGTTVQPGQQIDYDIYVRGHGAAAVPATFTDDLTDVLDDATLLPLPAGLTQDPGNPNLVTWSGTINPGEVRHFVVSVTVDQPPFTGNLNLGNRILGPNCQDAASTAAPCYVGHPVGYYTVAKWAPAAHPDGSTVQPGDEIEYTLQITHHGAPLNATFTDNLAGVLDDAELVLPLPAGLTQLNPTTLQWSGALPAAQNPLEIKYKVRVKPVLGDGVLRNVVVNNSNCPAGSQGPPCVTQHLGGAFRVEKTADRAAGSTVLPNQEIAYTITVSHIGEGTVNASWSDDLSGVVDDADLVLPLPAGVTRTGNTLSWSGPITAATSPLTFTYRVKVKEALGDSRLTNRVLGGNCQAGVTEDCVVEHVTGTYTVAKTANRPAGSSVDPGDEIAYTVTVAHLGDAAVPATWSDDLSDVVDDATLVTPLPAGVTRTGNTLSW
jgi:hypothetical protein